MCGERKFFAPRVNIYYVSVSFARWDASKMVSLEMKHYVHKVGVNVHHLEWCTKYRYGMFKQDKYKNLAENIIREIASRHRILIRELFVMPEHVHMSVECLPSMSQSKALQLLKGRSAYLLFRHKPKFCLRYPKGHFWSAGSCAVTVGYNDLNSMIDYIRSQEEHYGLASC